MSFRNEFVDGIIPFDHRLPKQNDEIAIRIDSAMAAIIAESCLPHSELTSDQITNVFGHILQAEAFLEGGSEDIYQDNGILLERGAQELRRCAGLFVSLISDEFGRKLSIFGQQLEVVSIGSLYRVRNEWQAPNRKSAENEELYKALGMWSRQLPRAPREFWPILPDRLSPEALIGNYTALEIADWMLNTEASLDLNR